MKIGYIRISTTDQNTARQEVLMQELGVEQVFIGGMSDARNETILKMFSLIEAGERAGSGIPDMVN